MRIGAIVQARMTSARLPGKVLRMLCGQPVLSWLLDGLALCSGPDMIVLATSTELSDDPVAEFCAGRGLPCFRGPLDDVAGRFLAAAEAHGLDAFVRLCGDSPLLDPRLVDEAVALFRQGGADLETNVLRRTFPRGQSVEVVDTMAMRRAEAAMTDPQDREHVTRHFYTHAGEFRLRSFESGGDFGAVNFCVDTADDLVRLSALVQRFVPGAARPGWRELLALEGLA